MMDIFSSILIAFEVFLSGIYDIINEELMLFLALPGLITFFHNSGSFLPASLMLTSFYKS